MKLVSKQYRAHKSYKFADHSRKILPKTVVMQHQKISKMLGRVNVISLDSSSSSGFSEEDKTRMGELETRFRINDIITYRKFVKAREIERMEAFRYLVIVYLEIQQLSADALTVERSDVLRDGRTHCRMHVLFLLPWNFARCPR